MGIRMSECNSFLAATQTPSASTVFVTETNVVTVTANYTRTIQQRQASPAPIPVSTIPAYASGACPNFAAYASACSCFGARAATTTAPPPPVVTSTVTFVSTTTVAPFGNGTRPATSCENPFSCDDDVLPICSVGQFGGCVCFRTVEGRDVCAVPNNCEPTCDTTADCLGGEVCIKQSCCSGGTCMSVDVCLNSSLPRLMFKKRGTAWIRRQIESPSFEALSLRPHDASEEAAR
ncbi:hypothetical protein CSOJ01_05110 [Colletotrichum sojae]|uniref:Uncharacterized protein n=1 Tax=Colletotrichum sojae TaxID=2175907 RepID=A0A8H6JH40_9PEZI|nr:hypothetical protein CSOJ01_05110 [Colletotrichum sojae]